MNDANQLVPVLIGMFWGAPLVAREIESGSMRLVLMQSISRTLWLSTRLLIGALGSAVFAGVTSLLVTWWARPWDHYNGGMDFGVFDVRDIGYGVFAFALGVLIGTMLRRTLPAMVVTLVVFAGFVAAFGQWVRPQLLSG
jgi:ABC-type transport system involved in multi-copper enzyme maturation permease subunit